MRSNEELMRGILQRKEVYLAQKQARRLFMLVVGLTALLTMMLCIAPGITGSVEQQNATVMGATIFGPEAGGYVIVALLAFTLGIVVALFIQKHRAVKSGNAEIKRKGA